MRIAAFLACLLLPGLAHAEEIFLSCQVTQIAASAKEGKRDSKLRKIQKFLDKDESLRNYQGYRYVGKRSLNTTKSSTGSAKLKNGEKLTIRVVSVQRAQKKNKVTVDIGVSGNTRERSFVDRDYLILAAGTLDKKSDLILAVHCPVFP